MSNKKYKVGDTITYYVISHDNTITEEDEFPEEFNTLKEARERKSIIEAEQKKARSYSEGYYVIKQMLLTVNSVSSVGNIFDSEKSVTKTYKN